MEVGGFQNLASYSLSRNAAFVADVMKFEPCLFEQASESLRNDNYELAIWAMSDRHFVRRCLERILDEQERLRG